MNRTEESRKYYLKNRERILEYQRKYRAENRTRLAEKRKAKRLEKQVYDFNRNSWKWIRSEVWEEITVDEWIQILKDTPCCPECHKPFIINDDCSRHEQARSRHPLIEYDNETRRYIAVCNSCINPFIRGRIG